MNAEEVARQIAKGGPCRRSGNGWSVCCSALGHDDSTPSVSVATGDNGGVVVKCHRDCSLDAILSGAALDHADLSPPRADSGDTDDWTPAGTAVARYRYTDAGGKLLFEVCRTADKKFLQRRPDPARKSGWDWKLGDCERPLYRLPEIIEAVRDGRGILIAEGEKDVNALVRAGFAATCSPHGAGKWRKEHSETLREADVVIVADKDEPGWAHARAVRDALLGIAGRVRIAEAVEGKDASDHLAAGHTVDEFVVIWPGDSPEPGLAPDIHDFLAVEDVWDWLVEGLIERGDRLLLTGYEGLGKSVLVCQLAVTLAAGIHPFRATTTFEPLRILLIDRENSERQLRRKLRPLVKAAEMAGRPIDRQRLFVISNIDRLDLGREEARMWLSERVRAHKPDVLFLGPLYKLHRQNLNDEVASSVIADALDAIRAESGCALVVEAHSGHGDAQDRHVRPIGSSLWLRWSEFGYGLRSTKATRKGTPVQFTAWRGPREERDWPTALHHGSPWPWVGDWGKQSDEPPPAIARYEEQELMSEREGQPF